MGRFYDYGSRGSAWLPVFAPNTAPPIGEAIQPVDDNTSCLFAIAESCICEMD
jgi:hypothetical protein